MFRQFASVRTPAPQIAIIYKIRLISWCERVSQYAERVMTMKRKLSIVKLALPLTSIGLMIWIFSILSRPAIALTDMQADSHDWSGDEIRTGPEKAVPVAPDISEKVTSFPARTTTR